MCNQGAHEGPEFNQRRNEETFNSRKTHGAHAVPITDASSALGAKEKENKTGFFNQTALIDGYEEWADEDLRRTLLASFSQPRHVNPEAYDQRMTFWRKVIKDGVRAGRLFSSSCFCTPPVEDLAAGLGRSEGGGGRRPLGIMHVINTMVDESEAIPMSEAKRAIYSDALIRANALSK